MRLFARKPAPTITNGYEAERLVDVVVRKTVAVTDLAAAGAPEIRLATVAALAVAGDDRVLDFGGAAGLHYRIACDAFPNRQFRWAVVETPLMVSKARRLEDKGLRFFTTVMEAREWLGGVDLLHSVGALQYTSEPEQTLAELVGIGAPLMLWAKLDLGETCETVMQRSLLSENGPGRELPTGVEDAEVFYPLTRMRRADFTGAHSGYRAVWRDEWSAFLFARH